MLALLRVAPLLPSPTLRAVPWRCQVGTGKQAHRSNWKAEFGCHRPGRATPRSQPLMYFFSGRRCSFSPALTLERISKESPDDYWSVMETLTAFVRERAPRKEKEPLPGFTGTPTDIAAPL